MDIVLHCAPPYRFDVPNAALGYLKGFLEARGIHVKNIYWNVILTPEIEGFNRGIETTSGSSTILTTTAISIYMWRHLMTGIMDTDSELPIDPFFSLILTGGELHQLLNQAKDKIDTYIKKNDLHKTLAGFTMKTHQWLMNSYIMSRLKEMNPDSTVVIGGITNEDQGRTFLKVFKHADFAIWGEGEFPLYYLIETLKNENPLNTVPNLIYREGDRIVSTQQSSEYPDLDTYSFADHTDYFDTLQEFVPSPTRVQIPILGSRSCPWNKCRFCVLNEEYPYRARSPDNIVEEIEYQSEKHDIDNFMFVDTDVAGNLKRFRTLLKLIIQSAARRNEPYHFSATMSPVYLSPETVKNMRLASFGSIQAGFEALTDMSLEKMRKRHRFAHNIQALKLGSRYNLRLDGLNTVRGIPPETEEDILENCINIKYVRFFLNTFVLDSSPFSLYKGSPFYDDMPEEERKPWHYNRFWLEIASTGLIPEVDRFEFFGFFKERTQHSLWDEFDMMLRFYSEQKCSYTWIEYENGSFIEEKGPKTYQFTLDRDETDILIFCDLIKSFSEVKSAFPHIHEEKLCTMLKTLKDVGFLYYDRNLQTIISVLDTLKKESLSMSECDS